ncbi:MAG: hypothetical protein M1818_005044 [Claussenomyces sp. TS43310]|nr:MAG: hypothetical protein M1818_005044 [Claussenomyces sp. TS43310]
MKTAAAGEIKRKNRNEFLYASLVESESTAVPAPPDSEREISLDTLRDMQHVFDQSYLGIDDWTDHTIIDQFQTSALRYQMYEMLYVIGIYQGVYCPNFHGYVSEGARNIINKAMTKKDPVVSDNIMVIGFFTLGIMLYIANTGDMRYTRPGSLRFHVDDNAVYDHDIHSMDDALVSQWAENAYCLFPCEPSWTYSPCNLQGMTGQVLYDRVFGTNHVQGILPRFKKSLLADFLSNAGTSLPFRNTMTSFTIPGLAGSMLDLAAATMCRGYLDDIAKKMWTIFRKEIIEV